MTLAALLAAGFTSPCRGNELPEAQALAMAKRGVGTHCSKGTPCHFKAKREGAKWSVLVTFTRRNTRAIRRFHIRVAMRLLL
jgi:hypothetical protein